MTKHACTLCGSRDWPSAKSACPLCSERETPSALTEATALLKAIKHWEDNVNVTTPNKIRYDAQACALCQTYEDCNGCPVALHTDSDMCNHTPYRSAVLASRDWYRCPDNKLLEKQYRDAAQAELDFLKSLQTEPSIRYTPSVGAIVGITLSPRCAFYEDRERFEPYLWKVVSIGPFKFDDAPFCCLQPLNVPTARLPEYPFYVSQFHSATPQPKLTNHS